MSDMTIMWLSFLLLGVFSLLFVVAPFFKKQQKVDVRNNNSALIEMFHQRMVDLDSQHNAQKIDKQSVIEQKVELKRRLLNDLTPEKQLTVTGSNITLALMGSVFLVSVSAIFYSLTGSHKQIQQLYSAIDKLPEYGERAVLQSGEPLSANELQAFALGLRTKLARSGDDAVAWMLLGRVAMSINDLNMAKQALQKAVNMQPDNTLMLLTYSQVLLMEGQQRNYALIANMLAKILKAEPNNIDAVSLLGLVAYEKEDWQQAKMSFDMLLSTMTEQDPRYQVVTQRLAEIELKLSPVQPVPSIEVTITLDSDLPNITLNNKTLFVFAKANSGPKMPLAVVKLTNFNLPLKVTLDDSNAMMSNLSLSKFKQVIVTARISSDESVTAEAGDLEGSSGIIDLDTNLIKQTVTINRIISSTGS